jgi:division protein CdvB (Snf7/Vps24/ESCRT-III family)
MDQQKALAKLMRSLNVMSDAMYVATRRTADAASDAADVDGALESALSDIHWKLAESYKILDELLAELQNPPTGP